MNLDEIIIWTIAGLFFLVGAGISVWILVRVGARGWFREKELFIQRLERAHLGERHGG